jgi:hypothetical protein
MQNVTGSAREIVDRLLNVTGDCLLSGNLEGFAAHFAFPYRIETFEGSHEIRTMEHFAKVFEATREYYASRSVTELHRSCLEGAFMSPDVINSTHQNHVISHGVLIQPAFPVFSVLHRIDGSWRYVEGRYAITDTTNYAAALMLRAGESGSETDGEAATRSQILERTQI